MSKSKKNKNFIEYEDNNENFNTNIEEYRQHKIEKRIRNALRSKNIKDLLDYDEE
jgi:hypothetical protein